ncbi:hypothetical protein DL766_008717 [Monosporascus sp. MC13-8B]|uniref:Reverse transcriptase domain-containing protein n=1 Tax=Monosporascus cannonballus TaxID=155416 RepID=A0ABY0GVZ8_9PEZI|nr:hypothetical protein DL762_008491 [Monosporascus cannonballus]RYO88733.1 hypothetical protein DL763_005902 [Monosporascus cannonballus]RYP18221.1 hypothetical protein DL766_008717 [Monosporascus sp. MC13-8B]
MDKTFHFVDGIRGDRASRRQMRRFVMKGKNAGKTFHRPSRLELARHQQNTSRALVRISGDAGKGVLASPTAIERVLGNVFLTLSLPVEFSPHSLKVINEFFAHVADRLYPTQLGISLDKAKSTWMPMMFADEDSLRRMVELRGGLDKLEGNLPLLVKICKTDISYVLQYGGPTAFFRNRMPELRKGWVTKGLRLDSTSAASSIPYDGLDPYLQEILLDVIGISSLFNGVEPRTLDLLTFQEMNLSICFRLIRFRPLGYAGQMSGIQAAYHTGLTIFMVTLFLHSSRQRRIQDYELVSMSLREVLDNRLDELDDGLVLWLMILGGIWTMGDVDGDWLLPKISSGARRLGLKTWDDARDIICEFPWINTLHEQPGRAVWRRVNHEV